MRKSSGAVGRDQIAGRSGFVCGIKSDWIRQVRSHLNGLEAPLLRDLGISGDAELRLLGESQAMGTMLTTRYAAEVSCIGANPAAVAE